MIAMIFDAGGFLQYIGEKNVALSTSYIIIKIFNIVVLFVLVVVVWRHLQFCQSNFYFSCSVNQISDIIIMNLLTKLK